MLDLLNIIFKHLPTFQDDKTFNILKNQLLTLSKSTDNIRVVLGPGFGKYRELLDDERIIITTPDKSSSPYDVSINLDKDNYSFIFEVNTHEVNFNSYYYDEELLFSCELYVYKKTGRERKIIRTKEKIDRNDYYYDYKVEVKYFNDAGEIINIDTDYECDVIFSEKFGIPLSEARFYRTHFTQNLEHINKAKIKSEMAYEDEALAYLFTSPIRISKLEKGFNFDFDTNEEHFYKALEFGYTLNDLQVAKERIIALKELLLSQIGEGEVVFESNLVENIASFIYNSSCEFLNTKGIVIKKNGDNYFMYMLEIRNNQVTALGKLVNHEELKRLYKMNEGNLKVEGLSEFLRLSRGRS